MSGETQNYHETRNPNKQTASYASVTLSTTSKSVLTVSTGDLLGGPLYFGRGYWDLGKKWHVRFFGQATTVLTPGNLTVEIRHQTGTAPSDAGGTILATSGPVALAASKTGITWFTDFTVEARAAVGAAAGLFAKGWMISDAVGALLSNTVQPLLIPAASPAAVNVDTTQDGYITLQWKRSGSTAEAVQTHDFQVNAIT